MGHLSPQRSFEYYNHYAMLMATYQLSQASIRCKKVINNTTGISNKKLKENNASITHEQLQLSSVRKLLFKLSLENNYRKSPSFAIQNKQLKNMASLKRSTGRQLIHRYGVNTIINLLKVLEKGVSVSDASHRSGVTLKDTHKIAQRAINVTKITTVHGRPRFVPYVENLDPSGKHSGNISLSPTDIQLKQEYGLLSVLHNNALSLREQNPEEWQVFIKMASNKLSFSRAYLQFSPYSKEDQQI